MNQSTNSHKPTFALLGNPNCGKTMLFNALTGNNQYVGNWPGVTVEQKIGEIKYKSTGTLVDLPGIYSLSTYSLEERISREYILEQSPDVIINIIDGTNLERNLYLTMQLIEIGLPMVVVINMMDEVRKRGDRIDCQKMSKLMGVPVIPISAKHQENISELLKQIKSPSKHRAYLKYDSSTETTLNTISAIVSVKTQLPLRFYATKLLEGDPSYLHKLATTQRGTIQQIIKKYEQTTTYGDAQTMLADARYKTIERILTQSVIRKYKLGSQTPSDKIDRIVTNRFLSYPLFFGALFLIFIITFETFGKTLQNTVELFFSNSARPMMSNILLSIGCSDWIHDLLVNGIMVGIGSVLAFVPLIALLFFFLSFMEDSGYMARAAFIMDAPLSKIGLSGRAFIPMIMGFGCSVPAIMAARTMENERDRRLTVMLTPFMSCGAKLPIYALFATAFFEKNQGIIIYSVYILGILVAIGAGFILNNTVFRGQSTPFIMELPPYRLPSLKSTLKLTWDKAKDFIIRAGTIIFAMSVVLWFLQAFDCNFQFVENNAHSILASIGSTIAPIFQPLGFGTWQATVAVLTGFATKEAVVSSMAVLYGAGQHTALISQIQQVFTPISAYSMMTFMLLCTPCMAACAAIKKEMNSWKWTVFTYSFQLSIAYLIALIVYQIGTRML